MALVSVKKLHKEYSGKVAVNNVSFEVLEGEIFGLLGPNGAGKSTTISILSGLIKPTSGDVFLQGQKVTDKMAEVKNMLGLVPQEIALYPSLTARENLNFWGKMYDTRGVLLKNRVEEVLEIAGLTERGDERIATYSGGMKRRINIAAALLHRPQLLIMDEPTVGIDPQSRNHILETVLKLNQEGMTVIYTSHYMEEVEYLCDRIGIMDHGSIIALGKKEELKQLVGDADKLSISVGRVDSDAITHIRAIAEVQEIEISDNEITVLVNNARQQLTTILETLTDHNSDVQSVNIQEPNLESVFLHLTGRALRD